MTRAEILKTFRAENPEITERVISDTILNSWLKEGNRNVCAQTRCIVDQDGTTISTNEDDERFDLSVNIDNFYDIDEFPGSGVLYNSKKIDKTTMADLDTEDESWRNRTAGTPKKWYRRGKWLCLDRPIDSNEYDLTVYAVLRPNDFDADTKTPFNELDYLEPFHFSLVLYIQWKAKAKVGKPQDATKAEQEYMAYIAYMKKSIGGNKFGPIRFVPKTGYTGYNR
jgi:hypothetical protein